MVAALRRGAHPLVNQSVSLVGIDLDNCLIIGGWGGIRLPVSAGIRLVLVVVIVMQVLGEGYINA